MRKKQSTIFLELLKSTFFPTLTLCNQGAGNHLQSLVITVTIVHNSWPFQETSGPA